MAVTPAHAETIEARFSKANDKYIFTVSSDSLPALNDPEFGKAYQSAIVFRNDSGADMKVTLAEVKELTNNTDVYARSYEHIYDDTKDYYNGSISKSAFETVLKPGEARTVNFDYTLDPENARQPDNTLMGQSMKCRFTFVGEYDKQPQQENSAERNIVSNMLDTDAGYMSTIAGFIFLAAAAVLWLSIIRPKKKNKKGK